MDLEEKLRAAATTRPWLSVRSVKGSDLSLDDLSQSERDRLECRALLREARAAEAADPWTPDPRSPRVCWHGAPAMEEALQVIEILVLMLDQFQDPGNDDVSAYAVNKIRELLGNPPIEFDTSRAK